MGAECRYCGDDAVGVDALGRRACAEHIEEVADDLMGARPAAESLLDDDDFAIIAEEARRDA